MYGIYGNIYHQYTPNVSIYIPYMDPMGKGKSIYKLMRTGGTPILGNRQMGWFIFHLQTTGIEQNWSRSLGSRFFLAKSHYNPSIYMYIPMFF